MSYCHFTFETNSFKHKNHFIKLTKKYFQKNLSNMEKNNYNPEVSIEDTSYTITWNEIENEEPDYENYLSEIESFFKEDFENDILEDDD